jgi:hypothetical protein
MLIRVALFEVREQFIQRFHGEWPITASAFYSIFMVDLFMAALLAGNVAEAAYLFRFTIF